MGTPTVNIGPRQKGRPRAATVIDCGESEDNIGAAIAQAIDPGFRAKAAGASPPYGRPDDVSGRIIRILLDVDTRALFTKQFFDGPRR